MEKVLHLKGIIRNVDYESRVRTGTLKRYLIDRFDINTASASGIIEFDADTQFGYSKWVSPKRTRSYPYARIYKSYHLPKRLTIIPIIKDEGYDAQNDRINYMTLSWMNLLNVYIILAWYDTASEHPQYYDRITNQQLNSNYVREKILQIRRHQKSALHWNELHFERDFADVYKNAVASYEEIGRVLGCRMHAAEDHINILERYMVDGKFNRNAFASSLKGSSSAAKREAVILHELEYLGDGNKAYFELENLLGGKYHLTADEVFVFQDTLVIQESKNSTNKFPSLADILDGLFKCILFQNIDELTLDDKPVRFATRLKITAPLVGDLNLPAESPSTIRDFASVNGLTKSTLGVLELLNEEANANRGISIEVTGN